MEISRREIGSITESDIEAFKVYLYEQERSDATIEKYTRDVRKFSETIEGRDTFDKQELLEYKRELIGGYKTSSVNSMLAAVNCYLEFVGAPDLKVKSLKVQKKLFLDENKELTRKDYLKLVAAARRLRRPQIAMIMETLATTGARVSEVRSFTVEMVRRGTVDIVNKGKERTIIITNDLRSKVLAYAEEKGISTGEIFVTRNGRAIDRSGIWKEMKALACEAGVDANKIYPHNLRHLFARTFYRLTKNLAGLADILGHSSISATRIYTASPGSSFKKDISRLDLMAPDSGAQSCA
ncbi:tyrosine-type recombinase/integrase [Aminicella lysinilytica]|uniref:Site-specific recombinase XerD n=1 Tax=Aminicella lysinilytica TaxID=433323 RepID=A0A4R6PXN0_9FIRM|nr:tyrosine-type recombinase/integrase [Aminicella lysinilytica]NLD10898.1 tyrosine-type recombinase/integrase [Clostridiales bacterium]TDP46828.1 site-specific recombinase XerD [Aminicella lysinilytica]